MVDNTRRIVEEFVFCLFRGDTMMPVLYYLPPSPPCRAVLMLARLLGLEFELKVVNILEGDHMKPEFLQVFWIITFINLKSLKMYQFYNIKEQIKKYSYWDQSKMWKQSKNGQNYLLKLLSYNVTASVKFLVKYSLLKLIAGSFRWIKN